MLFTKQTESGGATVIGYIPQCSRNGKIVRACMRYDEWFGCNIRPKTLKTTIFEIFSSEELLLRSAGYEHFKNRLIADGGEY